MYCSAKSKVFILFNTNHTCLYCPQIHLILTILSIVSQRQYNTIQSIYHLKCAIESRFCCRLETSKRFQS